MTVKFCTIDQPSVSDGWRYVVVEGKEVEALTGFASTTIRYNATQDCEDFVLDLDEDWGVFEGRWDIMVYKDKFAMRSPFVHNEIVTNWGSTKQKKVIFEGDNIDVKKVSSPKKKTPKNLISQAIKLLYEQK